jgi:chaperone required for assembly of F1-ATPase
LSTTPRTADPVRRFYAAATAGADGDVHVVRLDQRVLKTPAGRPLHLPTSALAHGVAAEWDAQGEHIVPASMPVTQLAFAAIDWTAQSRPQLIEYTAKYGETDLLCHRADAPPQLITRQAEAWDQLLDWARETHALDLTVVTGVIAAPRDEPSLARIRAFAEGLDDFRLTALAQAAGLAGSAVVALALLGRRLDGETAFQAAALDELWSLENWGEDAEARARLDRQRADFSALERFVAALG